MIMTRATVLFFTAIFTIGMSLTTPAQVPAIDRLERVLPDGGAKYAECPLTQDEFQAFRARALKSENVVPLPGRWVNLFGLMPSAIDVPTKTLASHESENRWGLAVSLQPDADDVIFIANGRFATNTARIFAYLTDQQLRLRAAGFEERSGEFRLVTIETASRGFEIALRVWGGLAAKEIPGGRRLPPGTRC